MKITVDDERVFPTLGIVAQPGDTVTVPSEDAGTEVKSSKATKAAEKESE